MYIRKYKQYFYSVCFYIASTRVSACKCMYAHVCVSVCLCMCMLVRVGGCQLISRIRVPYAELKTSPSVTPERRRFVRQSKRVSKTAPAVTASCELRTTNFWWNYFNYYFLCNYVCCCNYYSYYCCNTRNSCCVVTAAQRKEAKLLHRQESIVTIPTSRRPFVPWRGLYEEVWTRWTRTRERPMMIS